MADITYTLTATERRDTQGLVGGKGDSHALKCITSVVEVATNTESGSTLKFMRIPSNARISNLSRVTWDDLTSGGGSVTLDLGLASVDANITSDPNALSEAHAVTAVDLTGEPLLDLFEKSGDRAWEFVNGQSTDPGGEFDVYGTLEDDAHTQVGTVMVELYYTLD